jgi:hypothetical protein
VKSNGNKEKGSKKEGNQESLLFKEEVSLWSIEFVVRGLPKNEAWFFGRSPF